MEMKYGSAKPVPGTSRVRILSTEGKVLEKMAIYLPPECWSALKDLSYKQGRSASQTLESLIMLAVHFDCKE